MDLGQSLSKITIMNFEAKFVGVKEVASWIKQNPNSLKWIQQSEYFLNLCMSSKSILIKTYQKPIQRIPVLIPATSTLSPYLSMTLRDNLFFLVHPSGVPFCKYTNVYLVHLNFLHKKDRLTNRQHPQILEF